MSKYPIEQTEDGNFLCTACNRKLNNSMFGTAVIKIHALNHLRQAISKVKDIELQKKINMWVDLVIF